MKKLLITSIITGIAILSLSSAQIYAMGGGGMGGGGGMHGSSGQAGGGMNGSSLSSGTMHNNNTQQHMTDEAQQHMTDEDHALLMEQHMGDAGAAMGAAGSNREQLRKRPMVIGNQDGNASGSHVNTMRGQ